MTASEPRPVSALLYATRALLAETFDFGYVWLKSWLFEPDRSLFSADTPTLPTLRSECVGSASNPAPGFSKATHKDLGSVVRCSLGQQGLGCFGESQP
jgi:hypothetical protein